MNGVVRAAQSGCGCNGLDSRAFVRDGWIFRRGDPSFERPEGGDIFDSGVGVSTAAGATSILAEFVLGPSEWAVIKRLHLGVAETFPPTGLELEAFSGNTTWRVRESDSPVRFYDLIRDQIGDPALGTEVAIEFFKPGARITFEVEVDSAAPNAPYTCYGRIWGWTIPLLERV